MTRTQAIAASQTNATVIDTSTGAAHTAVSANGWPFVTVLKTSGHRVNIIASVLEVQS